MEENWKIVLKVPEKKLLVDPVTELLENEFPFFIKTIPSLSLDAVIQNDSKDENLTWYLQVPKDQLEEAIKILSEVGKF